MRFPASAASAFLVAGLTLGLGSSAIVTLSAGDALAASANASDTGKSKSAGKNSHGAAASAAKSGNSASAGSKGRGAIARELKNLNAMCANGNALKKAAAGSNVGQINIYNQKFIVAYDMRSDLSDLSASLGASDPDHDAAYYEARPTAAEVDQHRSDLIAERDALLWPNDSDEYKMALDDKAKELGLASADKLTADDIAAVVDAHNVEVHDTYDQLIADLQTYIDLLGQLDVAEQEEGDALSAAARGRDLSDAAVAVLQDAALNGC